MAKESNSIQSIPIEKIHALPGTEQEQQPDKAYGSLVSSILINGVKEPVILRPMENGDYQLVSGYRRKRAAELAKLKELPAQVYDMTEKEALDYRARAAKDPKAPLPSQPVKEAGGKEQKPEETKAEDKSETEKAPEKKEKKPLSAVSALYRSGLSDLGCLSALPQPQDLSTVPVPLGRYVGGKGVCGIWELSESEAGTHNRKNGG